MFLSGPLPVPSQHGFVPQAPFLMHLPLSGSELQRTLRHLGVQFSQVSVNHPDHWLVMRARLYNQAGLCSNFGFSTYQITLDKFFIFSEPPFPYQ